MERSPCRAAVGRPEDSTEETYIECARRGGSHRGDGDVANTGVAALPASPDSAVVRSPEPADRDRRALTGVERGGVIGRHDQRVDAHPPLVVGPARSPIVRDGDADV